MKKFLLVLWFSLIPASTCAEIVTDGSVGPALELEGPAFRVEAGLGKQAGANLFHSFTRFNLAQGESAVFSGPDTVQNVINRVTGGGISDIDGRIVSEFPLADFYLLNPAGVLFGPHAELDVNGSFHASTAAYLRFADDSVLTTDTQTSTFSSAPPAAFGFTGEAGAVAVRGSRLTLPESETLSLSGAAVDLSDGAKINLASGSVHLNGAAGAGELPLAVASPEFSGPAGPVMLDNALVQTSGEGGGRVLIRAGQFMMNHEAVIQSNTTGTGDGGGVRVAADSLAIRGGAQIVGSLKGSGQADGIRLQVSGSAELSGEGRGGAVSALVSRALTAAGESGGTPGGIHLQAAELNLRDGAAIESSVTGSGDGGDIVLETAILHLSGNDSSGTGSFITTNTGGTGNGGRLIIRADEVILDDGALLVAGTVGDGHGSPVELEVVGNLTLQGADAGGNPSTFFSTTESRAASAGDASKQDIRIRAANLDLLDGGRIVADTSGPGQGGDILVEVGGFRMDGGAAISTNTFERGAAGTVTIHADTMHLSGVNRKEVGSAISSSTTGAGPGGLITVATGELHLLDGAQIGTNTFDAGQGGSTEVTVSGAAVFAGEDGRGSASGLFSATKHREDDAGDAGNVGLTAADLSIRNQAGIIAGTFGPGKGGDITVHTGNLSMTDGGIITASSTRQGDAGKVTLVIDGQMLMADSDIETVTAYADGGDVELTGDPEKLLIYLNDSNITTSVRDAAGDGGNILMASEFIIQKGSKIIARAVSGDGGNIDITTKAIFKFHPIADSPIDASSQFGRDGEVQIQTPDTDLNSGLVVLATDFNEDEDLQGEACSAETAARTSSLVEKPRAGVPTQGSRDYVPAAY